MTPPPTMTPTRDAESTPTRDPERPALDDHADTTAREPDGSTWTQRTVEAITDRLSTKRIGRRNFLTKAALIGSAMAVDPIGFVLKPRTAWASVCGEDNEFNEGWSAFCATINGGANTCPSGSFVAGWWKIDNTTFCSGRARYIVDCNRSPGASCSCRSANGSCDRRRVCCNNFRYGQCNTQIAGTTEVVCRIVLCTPPWQWGNCTRTSLTSNQTRTHWSSRLPSRTNPTPIKVNWLEAGLTGSVLGDMVGSERSTSDGGAWARFDNGVLTSTPQGTVRTVRGPHADAYVRLDGAEGVLGRPRTNITGGRVRGAFVNGSTYRNGNDVHGVWGPLDDRYQRVGDANGWMGPPRDDMRTQGQYDIVRTQSNWYIVWTHADDRHAILRSIDSLRSDGAIPGKVHTPRFSEGNAFRTAARVSRESFPNGSSSVIVLRHDANAASAAIAAVATRLDAPILYTEPHSVPSATRDEIRRLGATQAIVVGDGRVIGYAATRELRQITGNVTRRLEGTGRATTARAISQYAFPDGGVDEVFLCEATSWEDMVCVAPLAHQRGGVVLLTGSRAMPSSTRSELDRLQPSRVTLVGTTSRLNESIVRELRSDFDVAVDRIPGRDYLRRSVRISQQLGGSSDMVVTTRGGGFADGLSATTWANPHQAPILLVDKGVTGYLDDEILRRKPDKIALAGSTSDITRELGQQIGAYLR